MRPSVLRRSARLSLRPVTFPNDKNAGKKSKQWEVQQSPWNKFSRFRRQDTTGFYAYIQARDQAPEDKAFLESEYFMASDIDRCLDFYYHMNGDHIGRWHRNPSCCFLHTDACVQFRCLHSTDSSQDSGPDLSLDLVHDPSYQYHSSNGCTNVYILG